MKVSIITVVYNGEAFVESCLKSVTTQNYPNIEYIVIDGASKDKTMEIINQYKDKISILHSEKDKGIYDAMNKGVALASGDIIGILNADDFYAGTDTISKVVNEFKSSGSDIVFGNLVFVKPGDLENVVRYYDAGKFKLKDFEKGDMPPHPAFFVKKKLYHQFGLFDLQFKIVADYEFMLRAMYVGKAKWKHLPEVLVKMRTGGLSNSGLKSRIRINREMKAACDKNGIRTSMIKIWSKYFKKVFQLFRRPG